MAGDGPVASSSANGSGAAPQPALNIAQKRPRSNATCDCCRDRKVRCELEEGDAPPEAVCRACKRLELKCTWVGNQNKRKRGPKLRYQPPADGGFAGADPHGTTSPAIGRAALEPSPTIPHPSLSLPSSSSAVSSALALPPVPAHHRPSPSYPSATPVVGKSFFDPPSASAAPLQSTSASVGRLFNPNSPHGSNGVGGGLLGVFSPAATNASFGSDHADIFNAQRNALGGSSNANAAVTPPSLSRLRLPTPRVPHIETLAPMWRIKGFLALHFDFNGPLQPIVHRPTFLRSFENCEYLTRPSFFALTCSMIAITLVTVPKAFLELSSTEISRLAAYANSLSRDVANKEGFDPPHYEWAAARYLDVIYHFHCGHIVTSTTAHFDAVAIGLHMGLDKLRSSSGLGVIEVEMRRRLLWIMYSSEKDLALFSNFPISMRFDFGQPPMPAELDDDNITEDGLNWSAQTSPSLLSGFNVLSKIYVVLADLLPCMRANQLAPPEGSALFSQIDKMKELEKALNTALAEAPPMYHLKRRSQQADGSPNSHVAMPPSIDTMSWLSTDPQYMPDFSALLADLLASEPPTLVADAQTQRKHALAVTQANVSVTYLVVLLELMKHQQELLQRLNPHIPRNPEVFVTIANALLDALLCVPIEAVATNGRPLTRKVRHMAASLPSVTDLDTAQGFISDYLGIVQRIEAHFGFRDDQ